jgi:integrase/recombinase XerD
VKILRAWLGDEVVEDITFTRIERLVQEMKAGGYSPATVKRKLAMLARALKMATMWDGDDGKPLLRYKPPFPQIVVNNLKDRTVTELEEAALFAAIEKRRQSEPNRQWFRFRVLLQLFFSTGGRLSEALSLGPKDVTESGGTSFVTFARYRTKSGKPRTVPLTDDAVRGLGSLMDHLVLDRETQEWRFFGFTTSTADVMFRQIRTDVQLETGMDLSDVSLHTIRHTVLTRLARGGMGLAQLQMWAGHADPKITAERYLHLLPSDLVGGLAILNGTGGTEEAHKARDRTKPVSVPGSLAGANGAKQGTVTVQ